jgi:hypothetical protein
MGSSDLQAQANALSAAARGAREQRRELVSKAAIRTCPFAKCYFSPYRYQADSLGFYVDLNSAIIPQT